MKKQVRLEWWRENDAAVQERCDVRLDAIMCRVINVVGRLDHER